MSKYLKNKSSRYVLLFWLSFAFVLILNIFVWLYLNQVERQFQVELQKRIQNASMLASRLIKADNSADMDLGLIVPGDTSSLEYLYYEQLFDDIRRQADLQSILLVTPQGKILVSSPALLSHQKSTSFADNQLFLDAASGKYMVSPVERYAGQAFLSAFSPVENIDGYVAAILIIEARANYFSVLTNLKNRLLLFSTISIIIILLIAAFLYRTIRETIRYQTTIKEREHLVQLGTMAASVAHELRNPLNIIDATNDVIKKKYARDNDELFQFIPAEINRLSALIENFLQFARTPKIVPQTLDLSELCNRLTLSLDAELRTRLSINVQQNITIRTDARLLEQALMNIINNAFQASPAQGRVDIQIFGKGRDRLCISIRDQGAGIPPEITRQIFEPFFTTREKGTGLGLAISKRLIEQLGGSITLTSVPVQGTTVEIVLPSLKEA